MHSTVEISPANSSLSRQEAERQLMSRAKTAIREALSTRGHIVLHVKVEVEKIDG
jgi:hypothetical protein